MGETDPLDSEPPALDDANLVAQRYARAISRGDPDAIAALFTSDAIQIDPVGTPANQGREAVRDRFAGAAVAGTSQSFTAGPVFGTSREFAFAWNYSATNAGETTTLNGIDTVRITDDLLIERLVAYWSAPGTH